jgi:hypothetical protein
MVVPLLLVGNVDFQARHLILGIPLTLYTDHFSAQRLEAPSKKLSILALHHEISSSQYTVCI